MLIVDQQIIFNTVQLTQVFPRAKVSQQSCYSYMGSLFVQNLSQGAMEAYDPGTEIGRSGAPMMSSRGWWKSTCTQQCAKQLQKKYNCRRKIGNYVAAILVCPLG